MTRRDTILFALLCLAWGVPYFFIRVAVSDLPPVAVVCGRTAIGALILLPVAARRRELGPVLRRFWPLLAYTVAEMAVPWFFLSSAEISLPSSVSGLLIAAVPAVATIVALVAGFERPDGRRILGLAVGLAGVGALVGLGLPGATPRALLEVGIVVLGYAVGPQIVARKLTDLPQLGVVSLSLALCALIYLPFALTELPVRAPSAAALSSVVALGAICTALAFVLAFALISSIGAVRMTVVTYVNPAVAVLMGVAFLGERATVGMGVGFVLILAGSYLTTRPSQGAKAPPGRVETAV